MKRRGSLPASYFDLIINAVGKAADGEKCYFSLHFQVHHSGKSEQELKVGAQSKAAYYALWHMLNSLSYKSQTHLPRALHGMGPPTPITGQDGLSQPQPLANLIAAILQLRFPLPRLC